MRPERTVQQHPVVQHGALIFEIGQPRPAIFAQRFGIIGLRQGDLFNFISGYSINSATLLLIKRFKKIGRAHV